MFNDYVSMLSQHGNINNFLSHDFSRSGNCVLLWSSLNTLANQERCESGVMDDSGCCRRMKNRELLHGVGSSEVSQQGDACVCHLVDVAGVIEAFSWFGTSSYSGSKAQESAWHLIPS